MRSHNLNLSGVVLIASLLLVNCATEPVADDALATPEKDVEVQPEEFPDPHLFIRLQELREKARSRKPSQHHLDWDIYEVDDSVYGRNINDPNCEFVAGDVETHADEIVLKGPAAAILPNEEYLESTKTGEIRFNNNGTYSVTGGGRARFGFPLKSGTD